MKVVLVTEKKMTDYNWLRGITTSPEFSSVVVADALELREVMNLFANRRVVAVIGPCTGLMHLADGVYTWLLNHQMITEAECPLLLTYGGKQAPERNYHPYNWWKNANVVDCCIAVSMKDESDEKRLILLNECPPDFETFNSISVSAREISCEMIFKFLCEKFPAFIKWSPDFQNISTINRIPTFLINLRSRVERRAHILKQFSGRTVFDYTLVEAIECESGRLGLWQTIRKIVSDNINSTHEYILICEDDHEFTHYYSDEKLISCIHHASLLKADVLLGGICFCDSNVKKIHNDLISAENFACMQFTLIFREFFETILNAQFTKDDCADFKISDLSNRKLVVYPFISRQKDFGYSDVSDGYYEDKMSEFFNETARIIQGTI